MLKPLAFIPFTAKELHPSGWLKQQLEIQADGLSGNLDKIWPDVRDSRWIGGSREGWERVPYWLDGFIPLAYLLDDDDKKQRAKRYIDAILERQCGDGWICPCENNERSHYDVWPVFLICKVLIMYYDCTGDSRIQNAVYKALQQLKLHINQNTLFNWGAARWFECLISIFWLYERVREDWLPELAYKMDAEGIDYKKLFSHWYDQKPLRQWTYLTHVVNLAMAIKCDGLMSRLNGGCPDTFALEMLEKLEACHGTALGFFTGDECLSGTSPIQGTECCSIVESMYSYEQLLCISGNPEWGDRLEALAFNALPATLSPDMWTHQYVQMVNQVECSPLPEDKVVFRTNQGQSHMFGLEPNFGCCTANFSQGWPKFALSTFMRTQKGIVSSVLAPSRVETEISDAKVRCELKTLYPFRNDLTYVIETGKPVTFEFSIRIPSTAVSATVNGRKACPGTFFTIEKQWSGTQTVVLKLEWKTEFQKRPNDLVCVRRGPLWYSLAIDEHWVPLEYTADGVERKYPYCDYIIKAESKWNYAYIYDEFSIIEQNDFDRPFSSTYPPVYMKGKMVEVDWGFENGVCKEVPDSRTPIGEPVEANLYPYGCTNLRLTEIPYINYIMN